MPRPEMMWRHVIISTRRSWLHGDQRGFRSRGHRIHSSGDYKHPPPAGEHAGLHAYHRGRQKGTAVKIPRRLRGELGLAILRAVSRQGYRILAISVSGKHLHLLVELPRDRAVVKRVVGRWKTTRTPAVRRRLPGSIWGEGGKYKPVRDRGHQRRAWKYIADEQGSGAWSWCYPNPLPVPPAPRRQRKKAEGNPT